MYIAIAIINSIHFVLIDALCCTCNLSQFSKQVKMWQVGRPVCAIWIFLLSFFFF